MHVPPNRLPEPLWWHRPHNWLWEPVTPSSRFPKSWQSVPNSSREDAERVKTHRRRRGLEIGSGSRFQDTGDHSRFLLCTLRKKTLTRFCEANIYNNMLYNIYVSTQE